MSRISSDGILSTTIDLKPAAIQEVQDFFSTESDIDVLQHVLGNAPYPDAPELAKNCIVNCIDTEDYERDHDFLTEIGLATFDSRDMHFFAANPGPHAEKMLKQIYFYHFRLLPNTHMVNRKWCPGNPDANRFGVTRFTTHDEAKGMMEQSFNWPVDENDTSKGYCPVIFLGHAGHGDLARLHNSIRFDASRTLVRFIDTQDMARALGLSRQQIGLGTLMSNYHVPYRDSHTAGNDAAYTIIGAILMAVYGRNVPKFNKTPLQVVDEVEEASIKRSDCGWGTTIFCTRCHSYKHLRKGCRTKICCSQCHKAGREKRFVYTHVTEDCLFRESTPALLQYEQMQGIAVEEHLKRESFTLTLALRKT